MLPSDAAERKNYPITTGVLHYFPNAIAEVARISKIGNDQHNPGQPLHWAKHKSQDQLDCCGRHLTEAGTRDSDGERHSAKLAWRALANLEIEILAEAAGLTIPQYNEWLRAEAAKREANKCGTHSTILAPLAVPAPPETILIPQTPR